MNRQRVVAIVGATATGKTDLGEALAEAIGGEVVCADARQVYRELEIGTGKPTPTERAARPHHLFDALALGDQPSAGAWARLARATCEGLAQRGVTPVLVGGSGLYLGALMRGLNEEPPRDHEVRARLVAELSARGPQAMHARLGEVDPATASRLQARDGQRIVRALEVAEASGRPLSWWHAQAPRLTMEADWRVLEVTCAPGVLAERIAHRTRAMFEAGLLEETRSLLERGLGDPLAALRAIGYDEAMALLSGQLDAARASEQMDTRTRQLAKRQRTWFRHQIEGARLEAHALPAGKALAAARAALGI